MVSYRSKGTDSDIKEMNEGRRPPLQVILGVMLPSLQLPVSSSVRLQGLFLWGFHSLLRTAVICMLQCCYQRVEARAGRTEGEEWESRLKL